MATYPCHCRLCWRVLASAAEDTARLDAGGICEVCAVLGTQNDIPVDTPADYNTDQETRLWPLHAMWKIDELRAQRDALYQKLKDAGIALP